MAGDGGLHCPVQSTVVQAGVLVSLGGETLGAAGLLQQLSLPSTSNKWDDEHNAKQTNVSNVTV